MGRLKPNSMFSRVMVLFTVVILTSMGILAVVYYVSVRSDRIIGRLEDLKKEGEEIAYLASKRYEYKIRSQSPFAFATDKAAEIAYQNVDEYVKWKSTQLIDEKGAYMLVLDKSGNVEISANFFSEEEGGTGKLKAFIALLPELKKGEPVFTRMSLDNSPHSLAFVVGVPWIDAEKNAIGGAVFIYTSAKEIRQTYLSITWQILWVAAMAFSLAIVSAYAFTKQMTKPLASMAKATEAMAKGDFEQKAEVEGSEEIQLLALSFNSMAQQLEQLENSRREFVANVSHELRSPMTSIHGFIQGMLDGTIPPQEHSKYLEIVSDETTRLTKLINDLLQLSRMEQGKQNTCEKTFELNELMRRVLLRRYGEIEQKQIEVQVSFECDSCLAKGNSDAIEQVVVNLLDNAIKFTPEKGTIWLGTKVKDGHIIAFVEDDGQEISPQDLPKIFDRFYKVDKAHTSGKGTGLGLSISKRIMDDHGQKIWAESSPSKTGFYFILQKV